MDLHMDIEDIENGDKEEEYQNFLETLCNRTSIGTCTKTESRGLQV